MTNTIWQPAIQPDARPVYKAIADSLERDLDAGVLFEGARLPTHRELASALGVTPLTITRAYHEAARRGLIESTVGRGTFVRKISRAVEPERERAGSLDLSKNVIAGGEHLTLESRTLGNLLSILREPSYTEVEGTRRHRAAAAGWISDSLPEARAENILITPGAQQGILAVLAAVCRPGDVVLAEELTYPRFESVARILGLEIAPVAIDEEGIVPASLDRVCRVTAARALYTVPSFQNPTGAVMSVSRREKIAKIAERHSLTVVEDDVYGFLAARPLTALASLLPRLGCYVTGTAKSISPALRLGFAHVPSHLVEATGAALGSMTAFTSSLTAEIFSGLIESGAARSVVEEKRELILRNRRAASRGMGDLTSQAAAMSPHLWFELPREMDARDLEARARARGIEVSPSNAFDVTRNGKRNGIRVSIGAVADARAVETAMGTLSRLIADPHLGRGSVV